MIFTVSKELNLYFSENDTMSQYFHYLYLVEVNICLSYVFPSLNFISSQCARGKSFIVRKSEVNPKMFSGKKLFKNITLQVLNFITVS